MQVRFLTPLFMLVGLSLFMPQEVKGRMIVQVSPRNPLAPLSTQALQRPGWRYLQALDLYLVDDQEAPFVKNLSDRGEIRKMESDSDIRLAAIPSGPLSAAIPNDPLIFSQDWVLSETLGIGILDAWNRVTGNEGVTVAIIDTGIDTDHPDLKENLWKNEGEVGGNGTDDDGNGFVDDLYGFNFREDSGSVDDENGHGSHLAGVIGAVGNNGIGIAGINWQVRLMVLKFTDANGGGTSSAAVEAINYAILNGADVINASWTLRADRRLSEEDSLLKKAIEKAGEAGIVFVTAAGNHFDTGVGVNVDEFPVYPARFALNNMLTVAALDEEGRLAGYSNYGPSSVDLAAPGSTILSTLNEGNYGFMDGTSVATAFVSGASALLASLNSAYSPGQIRTILLEASIRDDALEGLVSSEGRLNISRALSDAAGIEPLAASPSRNEPAPALSEPGAGCSLIR